MKKALIALVTLALVIPAVLFGEPGEKKDLTGVWEAKISPTGVPPPPMRALSMFRNDGSFVANVHRRVPPVPVIQAVVADMGPAYGRWAQTGNREVGKSVLSATIRELVGIVIPGLGIVEALVTSTAPRMLRELQDMNTTREQIESFD